TPLPKNSRHVIRQRPAWRGHDPSYQRDSRSYQGRDRELNKNEFHSIATAGSKVCIFDIFATAYPAGWSKAIDVGIRAHVLSRFLQHYEVNAVADSEKER